MSRFWRSIKPWAIIFFSLTACTPHPYKHRIATTYNGYRYIYYCDTILQDKQGFFFINSNGTIVRILTDAPQNQNKDGNH